MTNKDAKRGNATAAERFCRCEATIAPSILDGYACGNPDCWRTPIVKASFDAFVVDLVKARGEGGAAASDHDKA